MACKFSLLNTRCCSISALRTASRKRKSYMKTRTAACCTGGKMFLFYYREISVLAQWNCTHSSESRASSTVMTMSWGKDTRLAYFCVYSPLGTERACCTVPCRRSTSADRLHWRTCLSWGEPGEKKGGKRTCRQAAACWWSYNGTEYVLCTDRLMCDRKHS